MTNRIATLALHAACWAALASLTVLTCGYLLRPTTMVVTIAQPREVEPFRGFLVIQVTATEIRYEGQLMITVEGVMRGDCPSFAIDLLVERLESAGRERHPQAVLVRLDAPTDPRALNIILNSVEKARFITVLSLSEGAYVGTP